METNTHSESKLLSPTMRRRYIASKVEAKSEKIPKWDESSGTA